MNFLGLMGAVQPFGDLAPESYALLALWLKGAIVLILCLSLITILRRSSATLRHEVELTGMILLVLLPLLSSTLPAWNLEVAQFQPSQGRITAVPIQILSPQAVSPQSSESNSLALGSPSLVVGGKRQLIPAEPILPTEPLPATNTLVLIWLLGALFLLVQMSSRAVAVHWMVRYRYDPPEEWIELLKKVAADMGLKRKPPLQVAPGAPVPFVLGWFKPRVILPSSAFGWTSSRLEMTLRHELAHLYRGDPKTRLVALAAVILHWPNPLVWLLEKHVNLHREMACDEVVLQKGFSARHYARELLAISKEIRRSKFRKSFVLSMAQPSGLGMRIQAIALGKRPTASARLRLLLAGTLVILGVVASGFRVVLASDLGQPGLQAAERIHQWTSGDSRRLAEGLRSGNWEALRAGGPFRVPSRAVRPLVLALEDHDADIRRIAAWALGESSDPIALGPLRGLLDDPDARVRAAAARSLGDIGQVDSTADLVAALGDPVSEVRIRAAHALGDIQAPEATGALVRSLKDSDPEVVAKAIWVLGEIGDSRATVALIQIAEDPTESLDRRRAAVRSLGEIGDAKAGPLLSLLLDSPQWALRAQTADALGDLGVRSHVSRLQRVASSDTHSKVRQQARDALVKLR